MRESVTFIIPVLNEEKNIKDTIDTIERSVPYERLDYDIIVVDGGSSDRTVEIVYSLTDKNQRVSIISDDNIKGLGHAYKKGVFLARGDYIILIPGDNEVTGEAIQAILDQAGEADMIVPYFVNQEIRSLSRRLISRAYVFLINLVSGLNLNYYNGTVLHRREVLRGYNIRTTGFAYQAEILVNLIKSGFTYKEISTKIQSRSSGKTKIFQTKNIISVLKSLYDLFWKFRVTPFWGGAKGISIKGKGFFSKKLALAEVAVPKEINYIAVFLTFSCGLQCSYCINNYEGKILKKGIMDGEKWVAGLNRLKLRHNLPITLQGGEPTLHKDFYYIIENLRPDIEIDILTNLEFDIKEFISKVDPKRINRDKRFQSIRASYHPEKMDLEKTIEKALALQKAGFNIGIGGVMHPGQTEKIKEAKKIAAQAGLVFFEKDFLGFWNGKLYGEYKYPEAVLCRDKKNVFCRTSELLFGTSGEVYKCTRDVYIDSDPIGRIHDSNFQVKYEHRFCRNFGYCNPCDIKIKTNRFLERGHTAVDINF